MAAEEAQAYAIERLAEGALLAEIAQEVGIKRTTLYMRLQATPELVDAYARAREEGLLARGEKLRTLAQRELPKLPSGAIDPSALGQLKLEVDTEKWTLSKLLARVFGDKLDLDVKGTMSVKLDTGDGGVL